MKDDLIYLQHILDAIKKIEKYIKSVDYNLFTKNDMMIDAVMKELEIIGEAADNLSKEFKKQHPEIPFLDIKGMRNILIHEYFGVNLEIIWKTCKESLPELKELIKPLLK